MYAARLQRMIYSISLLWNEQLIGVSPILNLEGGGFMQVLYAPMYVLIWKYFLEYISNNDNLPY